MNSFVVHCSICVLLKKYVFFWNRMYNIVLIRTIIFFSVGVGISPGQEFTAVIHATSPLVSQSQPIMKLLQVVSKSKYCSQVLQSYGRIRLGSITSHQ